MVWNWQKNNRKSSSHSFQKCGKMCGLGIENFESALLYVAKNGNLRKIFEMIQKEILADLDLSVLSLDNACVKVILTE